MDHNFSGHWGVFTALFVYTSELVIDGDEEDDDNDQDISHSVQGNLLSQPSYKPGQTYLIINVNKIGIKDPLNYIDPFIEISIKG